jgi:hypothetical protein
MFQFSLDIIQTLSQTRVCGTSAPCAACVGSWKSRRGYCAWKLSNPVRSSHLATCGGQNFLKRTIAAPTTLFHCPWQLVGVARTLPNGCAYHLDIEVVLKDEIRKDRTDREVWILQHTLLLLPARNLD